MAALRIALLLAAVVVGTAAKRAPPTPPAPVAAPAPATIRTGVEKWRAGDYAGAVAIWTPFAADGDADALFNLGQAYKLGRGVDADPVAARDYYRKAAAKGHLPAQANLGIALFQAGEKLEAIKWLKTAADRGEARAQYVLGIAAFNGDGIPRSQSLGYGYLLRAQASGLPQAMTALGTIASGLSPGDRSAGEVIAASLAAGTGVPAGLATATGPRLIAPTLPIRTPLPVSTAMNATTVNLPPPRSAPPATAVTPMPERAALSPVPRPAPAVALREPTPAQADAAAKAVGPPDVATNTTASADVARRDPLAPATPPLAHVAATGASATVDPLAPKPARVAAEPSREPLRDPLASPPVRPLKSFETAVEPPRKLDGWRVQLGAFSSRKLADAAWADVKAAAAPATPLFATDGPVTKLQMGPFTTRDAAKAACTKLSAAGRACFVTQG